MRPGQPSYTAMAAAAARAAHGLLYADVPIFADDLAAPLIGLTDPEVLRSAESSRSTIPTPRRGSGRGWMRSAAPRRR